VKSSEDMEIFIKVFYEAYGGVSEDEPYGQLPLSYGDIILGLFEDPFKETKIIYYLCFIINKPKFPILT